MGILTLALTPEWLKKVAFQGVIPANAGVALSDDSYYNEIASAFDQVEREYGHLLRSNRRILDEGKNADNWTPVSYYYNRTRFKPILGGASGVLGIRFALGTKVLSIAPTSWIRTPADGNFGEFELVPNADPMRFIGNTWSFFGPFGLVPDWLRIDYDAGYEYGIHGTVSVAQNGTTATGVGTFFLTEVEPYQFIQIGAQAARVIRVVSNTSLVLDRAFPTAETAAAAAVSRAPAVLISILADTATLGLLDQADGLMFDPLVSSYSIGTDGFSESVGTNRAQGIFGARYQRVKDRLEDRRKRYIRQFRAFAAGVI